MVEDVSEVAEEEPSARVALGPDLLRAEEEEEATVAATSMPPRFLLLMGKSSMWGMTKSPMALMKS